MMIFCSLQKIFVVVYQLLGMMTEIDTGSTVLAVMGCDRRATTRQESSSRKEFQRLAMSSDRVPCRELAC